MLKVTANNCPFFLEIDFLQFLGLEIIISSRFLPFFRKSPRGFDVFRSVFSFLLFFGLVLSLMVGLLGYYFLFRFGFCVVSIDHSPGGAWWALFALLVNLFTPGRGSVGRFFVLSFLEGCGVS